MFAACAEPKLLTAFCMTPGCSGELGLTIARFCPSRQSAESQTRGSLAELVPNPKHASLVLHLPTPTRST